MLRSIFNAVALASFTFASSLSAQAIPLSAGSPLSGSLQAGDTVAYTVAAGDDYLVRGAVDQLTVDVIVRILNPAGRMVRTIDGPAEGPEHFQFETDAEGDWQIQVIPFEEGSGEYTIVLELLEPVATDPRELADQLLSAYDREDSPGAVVSVWRDGETVFSKAYGMANLSYGIPWEVDTRTNIGSTSKQFTAFAVMLLAERGELSLDDDVREHIPELPDLGESITIRHLLSHTTGYREFINLLIMAGRCVTTAISSTVPRSSISCNASPPSRTPRGRSSTTTTLPSAWQRSSWSGSRARTFTSSWRRTSSAPWE